MQKALSSWERPTTTKLWFTWQYFWVRKYFVKRRSECLLAFLHFKSTCVNLKRSTYIQTSVIVIRIVPNICMKIHLKIVLFFEVYRETQIAKFGVWLYSVYLRVDVVVFKLDMFDFFTHINAAIAKSYLVFKDNRFQNRKSELYAKCKHVFS